MVERIADLYAIAIYRLQGKMERDKLAEELRQAQKLEAIGTLAGGIAHDFNNILSAIIGYSELSLLSLTEDNPLRQRLEGILKAGERAKQLITQILTFSRRGEQERHPLRLHLVINEALKLLRSTIPTTIEIQHKVDKDCGMVLADPVQMHQVLMNICTNAYHAMRDQGGVLRVELDSFVQLGHDSEKGQEAIPPGKYVRLRISDTGCGMDEHTVARIFEPYFTTKEEGEGTGLGLSVVHGIVQSHNGVITVASDPGHGTSFTIFLPSYCGSTSGHTTEDTQSMPGGSESILFVDDEPQIAYIGQQLLSALGYRVIALTDSREAWQVFKDDPQAFDMVITDMAMPHVNGAELAKMVLQLSPQTPVILCTGYSDTIDKIKAESIGIQGYLLKPIGQRQLACLVRSVLDDGHEQ